MYKGHLFVIEGLDGVGKSSILRDAYEKLKRDGFKVILTSESTYSVTDDEGVVYNNHFSAELVRKIADEKTQSLADHTSQSLMIAAARRSHYQNVIIPLLKKGYIILMDRYFPSTVFNYQRDCKWNASIQDIAMREIAAIRPKYILLTASAEISRKRIAKRGISDVTDLKSFDEYNEIQKNYSDFVTKQNGLIMNVDEDDINSHGFSLIDKIFYMMDE